jgi:histidinol-phosphate/aromatic aminotransferase/cobyric acid decarboxylase-like protein
MPKMVVIVNPNSPTGQYLPREDILKILKSIPHEITFVVDETYIEYVDKDSSMEKDVLDFDNLVIIKSMSKVYALSGARAAYLVANKERVEEIGNFIPPWAVSLIAQVAAVEALKDEKYYNGKYQETCQLRDEMIEELSKINSIKIYPSVANFFLIELLDEELEAEEIVKNLQKQMIYVRNTESMSNQFSNKFIRIAVKNKESNQKVSKELLRILSSKND